MCSSQLITIHLITLFNVVFFSHFLFVFVVLTGPVIFVISDHCEASAQQEKPVFAELPFFPPRGGCLTRNLISERRA